MKKLHMARLIISVMCALHRNMRLGVYKYHLCKCFFPSLDDGHVISNRCDNRILGQCLQNKQSEVILCLPSSHTPKHKFNTVIHVRDRQECVLRKIGKTIV